MKKLSSLTVVFPAYNDALSLPELIKKTLSILPLATDMYEIIIVNDASRDNTAMVLSQLTKKYSTLRVITHKKNRGYGGALLSGFSHAQGEFIFYTDSDGQYEVSEIVPLVEKMVSTVDMVTGYKLERHDSWIRQFIGTLYNQFVRKILAIRIRDVDCDFRLFRKSILRGVTIRVQSGAFDAVFIKTLQDKGVRFAEIPVHHYNRQHGSSQFFRPRRIAKSLYDLLIFSFLHT